MSTKENLLKAYAGECQARTRYEMAGEVAKNNGLHLLEHLFTFTASQEKEHAIVFYNLIKSNFKDENITIEGNYPVDMSNTLTDLLQYAANNENDEANNIYPSFANEAKAEGFNEVANVFDMISDIERYHRDRFKHYLSLIDNNKLFNDNQNVSWMCLNCGFIYEGNQAIEQCPVCNHPIGYSIRLNETPFNV